MTERRQREPAPFYLNVVREDVDPRLPLEDRIDKEKTLEVRRYVVDHLGRLPAMARSVHEQFGGIVEPSPEDVAEADAWRCDAGWRTCQECARFDYQHAQEYLSHGGVEYLQRVFGGKAESSWLGDWLKYGWCDAKGALTASYCNATACRDYAERRRGAFLRAVGRLIKRVGDL
jgi:hypothetical protein